MRDHSTALSLKTQMLCVGGAGVAGILLTALAEFVPLPRATLILPIIGAALPLAVAGVLGTRVAERARRLLQTLRNPETGTAPGLEGADELADIARLLAEEQRRVRGQRRYLLETGATLRTAATDVQAACGEAQLGVRRQHQALQQLVEELPALQQAQAGHLSAVTALGNETGHVVTLADRNGESVGALGSLLARADEGLADAETALTALAEEGARITKALTAFEALAEEISLVALNASIEAARVGTAGQGTAFMADEVAGMASRARSFSEDLSRTLTRLDTGASAAAEPLKRGRDLMESGRRELADLRQACSTERAGLEALAGGLAAQARDLSSSLEVTARLADTLAEVERNSAESDEKVFRVSQRSRTLVSLLDAQQITTVNLREAGLGGRVGSGNT